MAEKKEKLTLLQKLLKLQEKCDFFKKGAKGHNYNYVDGYAILEELRPEMDKFGVILETHLTGAFTMTGNKNQFFQQCNMVWVDVENGEERHIPWVIAGDQQDISKAFGSGLTYCQRYFQLKYFNIPTSNDDPDTVENTEKFNSYRGYSNSNAKTNNTSNNTNNFGGDSLGLNYDTYKFPFGKYKDTLVRECDDVDYFENFLLPKCSNPAQKALFERRHRELIS